MRREEMLIGEKVVGSSSPCYVVAEVGVNHDGDIDLACRLVDAAADAGADAVKFQTFRTERLMIASEDRLRQQGNGDESAFDMFRRLELSWDAHEKLNAHARARGITFLSTPFDEESVDFLEHLGVPAFKIASADVTHLPLLRHVGSKRKPVLLSTGMSYLNEIAEAVWTLRSAGASEVALLHCVSSYPAAPETLNLRVIQTLKEHFELPVGFSDHSEGILMPLAAVALGAALVEKHFTLDRNRTGPDHRLSVEPEELRQIVEAVRAVESALGDGRKRLADGEEDGRRQGRRSIVAAVDIRAYETIETWMITFKRPGTGLPPSAADKVTGMAARRDLARNTLIQWEDLSPAPESLAVEEEGRPVARPRMTGASGVRRRSDYHA